jgi:hypothetical protein
MRWTNLMCGLGVAALAAGLASMIGCETEGADSATRNVGVIFTGFYTGRDGGPVVQKNSGASIKTLDLRQNGDQLEAIDNNNAIWKGSLGEVIDGLSSFTLEGTTTAGEAATFSGTLYAAGVSSGSTNTGPTQGTMQGTFIEPAFFSTFYGTATIPGAIDSGNNGGGGSGSLTLNPTSASLTANGQSRSFSVSGGSGSYNWSVSDGSRGTLNTTTGTSVTYVRTSAGNNTVTVRDTADSSLTASATITQP